MITAYIKNNCDVDKAYELFETMPQRNEVSYAAMISGFVRSEKFDKAEMFMLICLLSFVTRLVQML